LRHFIYFFSPFSAWPVYFISGNKESLKEAAKLGFLFGLSYFIAGIYWIYISLHDVGGMPFWMAGIATFCLCAFLATFPAIVGYLQNVAISH
jgi:apolipoprotein N-acyltransferase